MNENLYTELVIPTVTFDSKATAELFGEMERLATQGWNDQAAVWAQIAAQFTAWKAAQTGKKNGIRTFVAVVAKDYVVTVNFSLVQRAVTVATADFTVVSNYLESLKSMTDASLRGANDFVVAAGKAPVTPTSTRFSAQREGKAIADKAVKAYGSKDKAIKALEAALAAAKAL